MERRLIILAAFLSAILMDNFQVQAAPSKSTESSPRVFSISVETLQVLRREVREKNAAKDPAIAQLRKDADAALKQEPLSVTKKSITPPSGDNHDYLSLALY